MTLRSSLARVMVHQHEIAQELADWHVARMTDAEVEAELALYERQGVGVEVKCLPERMADETSSAPSRSR